MVNVFIILLGCNIYTILMNRLETSFSNIILNNQLNTHKYKISWFLSGGNKYTGTISEASVMKSQLDNIINKNKQLFNLDFDSNWNYILDEQSTNTAQNLIRASTYLNKSTNTFTHIYIVTSDFHYLRASYMMNLIDSSRHYNWILSNTHPSVKYDFAQLELVYMKNIHTDITNAFDITNISN